MYLKQPRKYKSIIDTFNLANSFITKNEKIKKSVAHQL